MKPTLMMAGEVENSFILKDKDTVISLMTTVADPQKKRRVVELLSSLLSQTYIRALKTFSYQNKTGSRISDQLLILLKDQYDDMVNAVHQISGCIRNLGYELPDSFTHIRKFSEVNEESSNDSAVLAELVNSNERIIQMIKDTIQIISDTRDEATAYLLRKRLKKHELHAWTIKRTFLR